MTLSRTASGRREHHNGMFISSELTVGDLPSDGELTVRRRISVSGSRDQYGRRDEVNGIGVGRHEEEHGTLGPWQACSYAINVCMGSG